MKIYTKTQEIPYNAQITVIGPTGLPISGVTFEDAYGIVISGRELEPYSEEREMFFVSTGKMEEEQTGLYEWESVEVLSEAREEYGRVITLENGDYILEGKKGKFGYFVDKGSIQDYLESIAS